MSRPYRFEVGDLVIYTSNHWGYCKYNPLWPRYKIYGIVTETTYSIESTSFKVHVDWIHILSPEKLDIPFHLLKRKDYFLTNNSYYHNDLELYLSPNKSFEFTTSFKRKRNEKI